MQAVRRIVNLQRILLTIEGELSVRNAIRYPSDGGSEPGMLPQIALKVVETQRDIPRHCGAIRHP